MKIAETIYTPFQKGHFWPVLTVTCSFLNLFFTEKKLNKGKAKRSISPCLKIWPCDLDSPKDYVCTKFGQNPLKDVDSRVHKDVTW